MNKGILIVFILGFFGTVAGLYNLMSEGVTTVHMACTISSIALIGVAYDNYIKI